tara:strand:- start:1485 stop:1685 length:201 start_codon:yes stop_codon:yes gene_type:complete
MFGYSRSGREAKLLDRVMRRKMREKRRLTRKNRRALARLKRARRRARRARYMNVNRPSMFVSDVLY